MSKREIETLRLEAEPQELRAKIKNAAGTTATYPLTDPLAYEQLFGPR